MQVEADSVFVDLFFIKQKLSLLLNYTDFPPRLF